MFFSRKRKTPHIKVDKSKLERETKNLPGFYRKLFTESGQSTQLDTESMLSAYHQRNKVHQSKKTPPKNPPNGKRLAELDVLRSAELDSNRDWDDIDYYKAGIRGIQHYRKEQELAGVLGDSYFELKAEPSNPFDSNAVAVVSNGHRIGYISAAIAQFFQGVVLGFKQSGKRLYVPGRVDRFDSGIVVLPTIRKIDQIVQSESSKPIDAFWESLPTDLRQKVIDNHFHFERQSAKALLAYASAYPLYAPYNRRSPEDSIPLVWNRFLRDLRISHNESVIRQRKSRNREMIRLAANGMSYREIGEKFGLKPATVGQIVRELRPTDFVPKEKKRNSIKSSQSGKSKLSIKDQGFSTIQERNAAIMHLNQDGYSHREIGEQMGLKRDTIKKIVQNMRKNS
ncbi:HIRAN domain-containing protein [Corynebacterium casei]|uniref:HIRAN domain-containing protein n=2 Tax=Corynebacterium casei TaxID=160386 RepID=A0ABM5PQA3_9CORY|nr:HIRAN domain-containing protein [Corynebacterium casei]AHI20199.1 hypothetical protein CCASEI_08170 [Corynebacterium casei LMG S-19264]